MQSLIAHNEKEGACETEEMLCGEKDYKVSNDPTRIAYRSFLRA